MEEIDLRDLFDYLLDRIIYIIITIVILVSGIILYDCYVKTPLYSTYSTIALVKNSSETNQTLTQTDISINQNLVDTYSQVVKSKKVIKGVIKELDLNKSVKDISKMIDVSSYRNTEIIKIKVVSKSSKEAYDIATVLTDNFILEVSSIYNMNNVSILDEAELDLTVCNNTLVRDIIIALVGGLVLSSGIITILFYFDDSFKYNDKSEDEIGLPAIAKVFNSRIISKKGGTELVVSKYPKSVVSESIKTLRTNLQFSSIDKPIKKILITSSIPGEGKSFITSNLAISFAETGKKVLIIDADMRKGRLYHIFNINNTNGYSNLLLDDLNNVDSYIKKTECNNVYCLTRGTIPPNPSELLNSSKNKELIRILESKFDIIIFDGVPCSGLTDSVILSHLVDKVIIVASNKYTPKSELLNTKKTLESAKAPIAGFIINRLDGSKGKYAKYYYYYGGDQKNGRHS